MPFSLNGLPGPLHPVRSGFPPLVPHPCAFPLSPAHFPLLLFASCTRLLRVFLTCVTTDVARIVLLVSNAVHDASPSGTIG